MSLGQKAKTIIKKLLKNSLVRRLLSWSALGAGFLTGGLLVYLGTHNGWLTLLGAIVGMFGARTWWICERRHLAERKTSGIIGASGRLVEAVNNLALETADLNLQVQTLSKKS